MSSPFRRTPAAAGLLLAVLLAPGSASADEVPPEAVLADIPIAPPAGLRHIQIDLAPPGTTPLVMAVATASPISVMTPLAAREAGVSVRRTKRDAYRRKTRLGRDVQFYVDARSSDTGARTGVEVGVLGGDFLSQYVVEIDVPGGRVRFLDPDRFTVPETTATPGETVVPIALPTNRPTLEVVVAGRPLRVLLHTGFDANLVLSGVGARAVGIEPGEPSADAGLLTTWGPVPARLQEIESLRIGALELGPLTAHVAPRGLYNQGGETSDSVLGLQALAELVVRVDYHRKRVWLRRAGD